MGRKVGEAAGFPYPVHNVAWAEAYLRSLPSGILSIQPFGHDTPTLQADGTTVP